MSWDHEIKSIMCPCGCGTIEQETKSDDWGRYEEGTPCIKCAKCYNKFNLITLIYSCPYKWKGDRRDYYLVPKDADLLVNYVNDYPIQQAWELAKNNFSDALIVSYSFEQLNSALSELKLKKSVTSLIGVAFEISKMRKRYLNSAKIVNLRIEVAKAIEDYYTFNGNYEQLTKQEKHNDIERKKYEVKVQENGILLNL